MDAYEKSDQKKQRYLRYNWDKETRLHCTTKDEADSVALAASNLVQLARERLSGLPYKATWRMANAP